MMKKIFERFERKKQLTGVVVTANGVGSISKVQGGRPRNHLSHIIWP